MRYVTITGRSINLDKVNYALLFDQMAQFQTAGYNQIASISGADFKPFVDALIEAGFVGENTLINPERVAAWEDAGTAGRVYLEGADRPILMPIDLMKELTGRSLNSNQEQSPVSSISSAGKAAIAVQPVTEKTSRRKKAE